MKLYFDDESFDGQLQRTVAKCDAGMANAGECLFISSRITAGDRDSWYASWSTFADGLVAQAIAAEQEVHSVSAASLRLRATEYYRQAFFWHRDDLDGKELTTAYRASVAAFRLALPHLPRLGRVLDGETPGYLFAPPGAGPFPTILHIGGYDNTAEELYASPIRARSWLGVRRARRSPARQRPLRSASTAASGLGARGPGMFELVAGQPEVDPRRIVLVGRSFGGLLAARGAAGTSRLAALIVDPGQYDMAAGLEARLGELWKHLDDSSERGKFDALLESPVMRTLLGPRMVTNGVSDPQAYFQDMRGYTSAALAPSITCPSFVTDNENRSRLDRSRSASFRRDEMSEGIPQIYARRGR